MLNLGNQAVNVTTRSRNLIPFPYSSGVMNSQYTQVSYDGVITVNVPSLEKNTFLEVWRDTLEAGKTYTLSGGSKTTGWNSHILYIVILGKSHSDYGNGVTFTTPEATEGIVNAVIYIFGIAGKEHKNLTFKPMLVEGDTALPYEPYIQRHDVRVMQNLIDVDAMVATNATGADDALRKNEDGSYTLTKNGGQRFSKVFNCELPSGNYLFKADVLETTATSTYKMSLDVLYKDGEHYFPAFCPGTAYADMSITFTKTVKSIQFYLSSAASDGTYTTFKNLRLYRLA